MSASGGSARIDVVLCDDVAEMRALLRTALEDDPSIKVVGEAGSGLDAARIIAELHPDVVLLDLSMPGMDGLEAIPAIAQSSPHTGIIVFSGFGAERMRRLALERGADLYVEKGEPLEVLFAAVRQVAEARRNGRAPRVPGDDGRGEGPGALLATAGHPLHRWPRKRLADGSIGA
jgi:DNA-binding NarL/FixJ family response regulator